MYDVTDVTSCILTVRGRTQTNFLQSSLVIKGYGYF